FGGVQRAGGASLASGGRSGLLIPVWIWHRCLSDISRWWIDMFKLRGRLIAAMRDWCLLLVGLLRRRIFVSVLHIKFPAPAGRGSSRGAARRKPNRQPLVPV